MAFTDEFAEALAELEDPSLVAATITWAGTDYPCFASQATKGGRLESYGWGVDEDLVIIVRGQLFGEGPPTRGTTLIFNEVTYRIDRVLTAPASCFLRLACVNASRGA
jgi:hypothetical protein